MHVTTRTCMRRASEPRCTCGLCWPLLSMRASSCAQICLHSWWLHHMCVHIHAVHDTHSYIHRFWILGLGWFCISCWTRRPSTAYTDVSAQARKRMCTMQQRRLSSWTPMAFQVGATKHVTYIYVAKTMKSMNVLFNSCKLTININIYIYIYTHTHSSHTTHTTRTGSRTSDGEHGELAIKVYKTSILVFKWVVCVCVCVCVMSVVCVCIYIYVCMCLCLCLLWTWKHFFACSYTYIYIHIHMQGSRQVCAGWLPFPPRLQQAQSA